VTGRAAAASLRAGPGLTGDGIEPATAVPRLAPLVTRRASRRTAPAPGADPQRQPCVPSPTARTGRRIDTIDGIDGRSARSSAGCPRRACWSRSRRGARSGPASEVSRHGGQARTEHRLRARTSSSGPGGLTRIPEKTGPLIVTMEGRRDQSRSGSCGTPSPSPAWTLDAHHTKLSRHGRKFRCGWVIPADRGSEGTGGAVAAGPLARGAPATVEPGGRTRGMK
jgi:hypothetical protein